MLFAARSWLGAKFPSSLFCVSAHLSVHYSVLSPPLRMPRLLVLFLIVGALFPGTLRLLSLLFFSAPSGHPISVLNPRLFRYLLLPCLSVAQTTAPASVLYPHIIARSGISQNFPFCCCIEKKNNSIPFLELRESKL